MSTRDEPPRTERVQRAIDRLNRWDERMGWPAFNAILTELRDAWDAAREAARPPAGEDGLRESVAQAIYDAMRENHPEGQAKPWVPGGNSLKQDEARRRADRALSGNSGGLDTPHGPVECDDPRCDIGECIDKRLSVSESSEQQP